MANRNQICPFQRRQETPLFSRSRWLAEWWCVWSNLPFLFFGVSKIVDDETVTERAVYMLAIGLCSGIHHASGQPWTVLIDYIPIVMACHHVYDGALWYHWSYTTWVKIILSLAMLINDHVWQTVPVPWAHCTWHIMAAFTVASAFSEIPPGL